ncbi:RNA polymerase sigma factor [uncultured Brevundimonas sp.]|uniref:RNA polymerase sigma factor n=1 Tax=uncultured Brevundimonas sp. TaxID=213418 RepID=UPI0030EF835B|tara:strand:- start:607 stop:1332 length:726 start_codon:yes stop_codon:yes gene_type:complete
MRKLKRGDHATLDETELVRLARAGDGDAFRVIMQRGNQRLFRVARGVVRDDAEAEDVLQEAYVRAFTAIGGFRGEAGIMTWLTRIVLNEARGRLRRRRPMVALDQLEAAHMDGSRVIPFPNAFGTASPEADAARAQIRALIEHAVDDLPEAFRIVFIMRDIEECSVDETAATLQIKPETVKTRLHRARRLLRQALDARLASTMVEAFPFMGMRCERITEAVLARLDAGGCLDRSSGTSVVD